MAEACAADGPSTGLLFGNQLYLFRYGRTDEEDTVLMG
ncbi:MAG: hypothetical protein OJF47_003080 [Nitrospira sp.]|nr:MAG: hypothetical protein OJF47_003080 [Nitrospira sp.]